MSETIRGRFYFKRTSNGNLLGEFSNYQSDGVYTESADLIGKSDGYFGNYTSTWQEGGKPYVATLSISPCERNPQMFKITWVQNGKLTFKGEGMLCDDILVGDYHSIKN